MEENIHYIPETLLIEMSRNSIFHASSTFAEAQLYLPGKKKKKRDRSSGPLCRLTFNT